MLFFEVGFDDFPELKCGLVPGDEIVECDHEELLANVSFFVLLQENYLVGDDVA